MAENFLCVPMVTADNGSSSFVATVYNRATNTFEPRVCIVMPMQRDPLDYCTDRVTAANNTGRRRGSRGGRRARVKHAQKSASMQTT